MLASTGSAFVWELLEATAYNAEKFLERLNVGKARFTARQQIANDPGLSEVVRARRLSQFDRQVAQARRSEDPFRLPPRGFTIEHAKELFRMSGDLKDDQER